VLSVQTRIKIQATVSPNYLLGGCVRGESNKRNLLLGTALVLAISNRAENLCYQFKHG